MVKTILFLKLPQSHTHLTGHMTKGTKFHLTIVTLEIKETTTKLMAHVVFPLNASCVIVWAILQNIEIAFN